ncbi:MAG: monomethylamine:corrinoid methyltransferase [Deltaproteobacteria bacterium]|nr:monomethylamine:corrinoid methyltransferase [Deltaproteobacteria bacterium]MBW2399191.1 monomethylamine:corrinoid methyltransferase [Deltaproteobacteria bacterium]
MGKFLWEAIQRSTTGPLMSEEEFETELFPTVLGDLQKKYRIEWDPDEPCMIDPDMADAIFQAGKELLLEVGLYCKNTKRIIKFSQEEIEEAICSAKHEVTLGHGRQAITLKPRAPGDEQHLYTFFPAGQLTTDVQLYKNHAITVMQEPTCDGVIPLPLFAVGDMKNIADTPASTLVCLTEARIMNEAAAWVGKPGLFFGIPMSATTPLALMSTFASGLYNKNNCTLPVQILQDMRVDYDRFNLAFYAEQQGIEPWMSCSPTLYAYLTGPEQGAMEIIAHTLGMLAYSGGTLTQAMSVSVHGTYVGNDISWCNSAAGLAAERNLKLPWVSFGMTGNPAGSLSDDNWYDTAAACINGCISGMEALWLAGGNTGLEARWAGEIARAAATLSPKQGVEIIKKINAAEREPNPPAMKLDELYDLQTLRPKQVLVDHYRKFTRIFRDLGLDYPTWDH